MFQCSLEITFHNQNVQPFGGATKTKVKQFLKLPKKKKRLFLT